MSEEEIKQFIRDNYIQMTDKELAEHIPVNERTVHKKRQRMGLQSPKRQYKIQILPRLYIAAECYELWVSGMNTDEIAKTVSLSSCTVLKHISRFLPVKKGEGKVIVKQSKV